MVFLIPIGAIVLVALMGLLSYNRFVRQRQLIDNAWSNVDTELKRRYDLIPNLVEVVKGYAAHERTTLEDVIAARSAAFAAQGSPAVKAGTENVLADGLRRMMGLAEAYPQIRADQHFLELQRELVTTENRIQAARRLYNGNVRDYNTRVESFPSLVIARVGNFVRAEFFEIDSVMRTAAPPAATFS